MFVECIHACMFLTVVNFHLILILIVQANHPNHSTPVHHVRKQRGDPEEFWEKEQSVYNYWRNTLSRFCFLVKKNLIRCPNTVGCRVTKKQGIV